ncbi:uncharacterized protein LOC130136926 isoform X1 [Syzygium oleosum]|uniref:uncharacterized protein LOC130136926 isoform X1 n=1 Tax=Syzygium oleosum TaxID=219896 RepID=UPI0024BB115D|nr:uncharacterized protein LOC130136926 isoform X1 [Syzygium oleosum]
MASILQNVLMALTMTMNKFASSNVQAIPRSEGRRRKPRAAPADSQQSGVGTRRCLLLLSAAATAPQAAAAGNSQTELLKIVLGYLKKSEENKEKNDKERLESYYKRNYKDYFEFVEGSLRNKKEQLTESEKAILDWLRSNK